MESLDIGGVPVNGVVMVTKPIIDGGQRLLDDFISLLEVLNEFVMLI